MLPEVQLPKHSVMQLLLKVIRWACYANLNWWNNYLTDKAFNNSKWYKWVAQYNSQCDYKGTVSDVAVNK